MTFFQDLQAMGHIEVKIFLFNELHDGLFERLTFLV